MKATIKLISSYKETKKGFPIYIDLVHLKQRKRKIIGYSVLGFWDYTKSQPFRQHPEYFELLPEILTYKAKITKLHYGNYTFEQATQMLFGIVNKHSINFYENALTLCDDSTNGKLYRTVLNSFNLMFPRVLTEDITRYQVRRYMDSLLKVNSANGVHTYMRTLNAIFSKLSTKENPFKGIRPKKVKTINKALSDSDVIKLITTRTLLKKFDGRNTIDTINYPRYYWMLMFYLGGIDFVDLAKLRYDRHVINNRIQFNRNKGGTNVFVNNLIPEEAKAILRLFNCQPYLVPIHKYKDHHSQLLWCNKRLNERTIDLNLTKKPLTKSARYTFITKAQQLLIDERITIEIVGHAQQKTHSIYTDEFPLEVRDRAHKKIIDFNHLMPDIYSIGDKSNFNDKIFKEYDDENLFYYCLEKIKFEQNRRNIGGLHFWYLKYLKCKKYEFAEFWNSLNQPFKIEKYDKNSVGLDTYHVDEVTNELDHIYKTYTSI